MGNLEGREIKKNGLKSEVQEMIEGNIKILRRITDCTRTAY